MILSMREQGLIFLFVCLLGFSFGGLYDILRILRRTIRQSRAVCMTEDFLYWLLASFFVFYILLGINLGEVRLYMVLGFMGGMAVYFFTLSPVVIGFAERLIGFWGRVFTRLFRLATLPVKFFMRPVFRMLKIVKRVLKKKAECGIIKCSNGFKSLRRRFKWPTKKQPKKGRHSETKNRTKKAEKDSPKGKIRRKKV